MTTAPTINRPIAPPARDASSTGLTAVDLFSGIGGFHIAAIQNGIAVKFASEIDTAAAHCYETNLGLTPHGDITQCKGNVPPHDILMAGFPCQPFSIMGRGTGLEDGRGSLVFEVVEIAGRLRPAAIILENVRQFSTHNHGKTIGHVIKAFEELGYTVTHSILNALNFGIPQKRERTFIVALKRDAKPMAWPTLQEHPPSLKSVLQKGRVPARYYASPKIQESRRLKHQTKDKPTIWHENKGGQVTSHSYCCALRANASHNYLLVNGKRRLTERELLRLQGFPEWYTPTSGYCQTQRQIGNAVPVPVASAVLTAVVNALETNFIPRICDFTMYKSVFTLLNIDIYKSQL